MPYIVVYGLQTNPLETLQEFRNDIKATVASIRHLQLTTKHVSVFIPSESIPPDQSDIVVEIRGLTAKTERNVDVQRDLARRVLATVQKHVQKLNPKTEPLIEVFVVTFEMKRNGFATNLYQETKRPKR